MKKYKYIVLGIFVVFVLFQSSPFRISIGTKAIEINNYTATIHLTSEGDMLVHEEWMMTYNEPYRVRFRDIGYRKFPSNYPLPYSITNEANFANDEYSMAIYRDDIDITSNSYLGTSMDFDRDELGEFITCEPYQPQCESLFIDTQEDGGLFGDIKFIYEYRINGAVTNYRDTSELNWVLFKYAETSIDTGIVKIYVPGNTLDTQDYHLFVGSLPNATTSIENDTITIGFSELKEDDYLEFRLLVPNTLFPNVDSINTYIHPDMNLQVILDYQEELARMTALNQKMDRILYTGVIVQLCAFAVLFTWKKRQYLKPFDIPLVEGYITEPPCDYPAAMINRLFVYNQVSKKDITLTILDLIDRGYISIDDAHLLEENDPFDLEIMIRKQQIENGYDQTNNQDEFDKKRYEQAEENFYLVFTRNESMSKKTLRNYEKTIMEWFFDDIGDGHKVTTKQINEYGKTDSSEQLKGRTRALNFVDQLTHEVLKEHFIDKAEAYRPKVYSTLIVPAIAFVLTIATLTFSNPSSVSIICVILLVETGVAFMIVNLFKRRSKKAEEIYQRYQAYKRQLENQAHVKDASIHDVEYMDHILLYATLFDLKEDVLKGLEDLVKDPISQSNATSNETRTNNRYYNHYYYQRLFRRELQHVSTKTNRFFINPSSGSSSGGSSGGGSFGGGGGGGGRSR